MSLQHWAKRLLTASAPQAIVDLHVADTAAAFATGLLTREGKALARLDAGVSPVTTAAAVGAIARLSECDNIHVAACITPGAIVVPVALALGTYCSRADFNRAIAAGYDVGLRLGLAVGGAHALARGVWPTLLATPLMAAVTAGSLAGLDENRLAHAMALALAGGGGRAGRIAGEPSGRWLVLAEAVARGIRASRAAGAGFRGDRDLATKAWLVAQAGHDAIDPETLESTVGPSLAEVDCKAFPIARQGANAVVAFQTVLARGIDPHRIDAVEVFVPPISLPLLSRPMIEDDRLSRLCNIGLQLALAALAPDALYDAERGNLSEAHIAFAERVALKPEPALEVHLPARWAARVVVFAGAQRFEETVIRTPFDHDAPDLEKGLREKWRRLGGAFAAAETAKKSELWDAMTRLLIGAATEELS
jgi:2-methylcitrate dehydratase PrpD